MNEIYKWDSVWTDAVMQHCPADQAAQIFRTMLRNKPTDNPNFRNAAWISLVLHNTTTEELGKIFMDIVRLRNDSMFSHPGKVPA